MNEQSLDESARHNKLCNCEPCLNDLRTLLRSLRWQREEIRVQTSQSRDTHGRKQRSHRSWQGPGGFKQDDMVGTFVSAQSSVAAPDSGQAIALSPDRQGNVNKACGSSQAINKGYAAGGQP